MTLEQRMYRNPLDVLIEEESRTCKGCAHAAQVFERQYCSKGKKFGKRCRIYQEKRKGK